MGKKIAVLSHLIAFIFSASVGGVVAKNNPSVVNIVLEHQSKAYLQVANSFKQTLVEQQSNIEILVADKVNTTDRVSLNFILGDKALSQALAQKQVKLLATLIADQNLLSNAKNATGLYMDKTVLIQLKWYKAVLPDAKRVGILYNPKLNQSKVEQFRAAATELDLEIIAIAVNHPRELPAALKEIGRKADSILSIADKLVYSNKTAKAVLLFSYHNRIPLVGLSRAWVKAGALYALEWDYKQIGEQSAAMALDMLNDPHAPIPAVKSLSKQFFSLNTKTAKQLKLNLDQKLLTDASTVYQ